MDIKIPERYNYISLFLTLRCNLACAYCLNKQSGFKKRDELPAEAWIDIINRMDMEDGLTVTLEGGEPTLHKGIYKILEKARRPVDLLTNLQFDVDAFMKKADPRYFSGSKKTGYKSIRVSYHNQDQEELLKKAGKLQDAGYSIGIFSINVPDKVGKNMEMAERARKAKVYFYTKDYLGMRDGKLYGYYKYDNAVACEKRRIVMCRTRELLVAPDGACFRCHRDLYANENPIGIITNNGFEIQDIFRICKNYGDCSPCDVKLKTNRVLEAGNCSVEIKC